MPKTQGERVETSPNTLTVERAKAKLQMEIMAEEHAQYDKLTRNEGLEAACKAFRGGDVIPPEAYAQTVKDMYAVSASQAATLPRQQGKLAELALGYQGGDVRRET